MFAEPIDTDQIVVTASRAPGAVQDSAASASIIDARRIDRLGEPSVPALLRLTPSAAVATSGSAGALTEVRIRGAEANHTLLFVDGIRANDPAAGDAPRFELLNADLASRIEVVRGPQSALWGSQAIGGVVAVTGDAGSATGFSAQSEVGSRGFRRAAASASLNGTVDVAAGVGFQRSDGIDIFGGGDPDGYRNLSARVRASVEPAAGIALGITGFALTGRSEFDGSDPVTFARTHDLTSRNRLAAARIWTSLARPGWSGTLSVAQLGSTNRNRFAGQEINRTAGRRSTLEGQVERQFTLGSTSHRLIAAAEHEAERFRASDQLYGGFTDQQQDRSRQALTAEWQAKAGPLNADLAIRRDRFNRFKDATTLRASLLGDLSAGVSLAASYGEGIAQPTFFDLYGFFPGSFAGNPGLKPERSRGIEASVRFRRGAVDGSLGWYRQRLRSEIVDVFDSATFLASTVNREDNSRRSGVEAELGWAVGEAFRLTAHYAFASASEPDAAASTQVREVRRPRHSGSIALDGARGPLTYGASLAYTGARGDTNFDVFPFERVRLGSYWLGGARVGYAVGRVELFARVANAFDERYQDAFGYRTEGRSVHAGLRLAARR